MKSIKLISLLFVGLLCFPQITIAKNNLSLEVDFLIGSIERSDCLFERNGKTYSASKAAEHIQKKYDYYESKIKTSEQFIELAASKSYFTNSDYLIICPKQAAVKTSIWLSDKLDAFRRSRSES